MISKEKKQIYIKEMTSQFDNSEAVIVITKFDCQTIR